MFRTFLFIFVVVAIAVYFVWQRGDNSVTEKSMFTLTSGAFEDGGAIPSTYTCDGENINPPLAIGGVPEGAKSLALIMDDPDAPVGLWVHWVVFDIDPASSGVGEGEKPASGTEGTTTYGKPGYGGPCPPDREHRYLFKLYALDTTLDLDVSATKEDVEKAMDGHILEQTELMGRYDRQR